MSKYMYDKASKKLHTLTDFGVVALGNTEVRSEVIEGRYHGKESFGSVKINRRERKFDSMIIGRDGKLRAEIVGTCRTIDDPQKVPRKF